MEKYRHPPIKRLQQVAKYRNGAGLVDHRPSLILVTKWLIIIITVEINEFKIGVYEIEANCMSKKYIRIIHIRKRLFFSKLSSKLLFELNLWLEDNLQIRKRLEAKVY